MMTGEHVEHLLSRAYDGDLAADERALLDRHLSACAACSAAYADLVTAVDTVRSLPPARMPHPVRLPEGLPRAAARRRPWSRGAGVPPGGGERRRPALPLRHPWASAVLGTAATAALVAAVVIPLTLGGGPAMNGSASKLGPSAAAGPAQTVPTAPCGGCATAAECPAPLAPGGTPLSTAIPAVYNNRVVRDDGVTTAIVATSVSSYAPGQTVAIYARLVDDLTGAVTLPCTYLAPAPGYGSERLALPASGALLPEVVPGSLGIAGQAELQVRIPAAAVAGETLEIVVEVPAAGGEPAHQVTLPVTVG